MAEAFAQWAIALLHGIRPKGSLKECVLCYGRAEMWQFSAMGQLCPQPALLVCSAWRGWADGDIAAPAVLHALLYIWDLCLVMGKHYMHPWPQVLSSLYLHYWSPTKIEASFHQHRANQDNTCLNFTYSLNRQDRQRVAVETKALERWCDMTWSPSRTLRARNRQGFLTPSPNDLSIGAC